MSKKTSFANINSSISPFAQAFSDCSVALGYYTNLANALTAINQLIADFSVGNFNGITKFLTLAKYNQLGLIFNGLQTTIGSALCLDSSNNLAFCTGAPFGLQAAYNTGNTITSRRSRESSWSTTCTPTTASTTSTRGG